MKLKLWLSLAVLALLAPAAAGCGGGGRDSLPPDAVAKVGPSPITRQQLGGLMAIAAKNLQSRGRRLPARDTEAYRSMRSAALAYLVRQIEWEQAARSLGIAVEPAQVDRRLAEIRSRYANGSAARYRARLKEQGLTENAIRGQIELQLLDQAIARRLTRGITVSRAEANAYYAQHRLLFSGQPRASALAAIERQLFTIRRNTALSRWVQSTAARYCSGNRLSYRPGFAPKPDPCTAKAAAGNTR